MKKIFTIILCLIALSIKAEFISATLYFNDGSKKVGFSQLVGTEDNKVKFKVTLDSEKEKIPSDDLKKIEFKDSKNNLYVCERLKVWSINILKYKYFEKKRWLYQLGTENNYSVYVESTFTTFIRTNSYSYPNFGESFFYYRYKKDEIAYLGFAQSDAGVSIVIFRKKEIKNMINEMFGGKCNLDQEIEKIKFDRKSGKDPFKVLDILIKSNCK